MSKRVLLVIGGGVAAYKALEVIRGLRKAGVAVRVILTEAGARFVTPLSVAALSGEKVYRDLFDLNDEAEMGHIQLSRQADLIVVAPATAALMAKAAQGLAPDLASTALLASDKPVLMAPAMNVRMWRHPATARNVAQLLADGVAMIGPEDGEMACGEYGPGRMAEPETLVREILRRLAPTAPRLAGRKVLVTAGPTHEAIDPVRYIANRSSGKQGYAIAAALAALGAEVSLISGPTALSPPSGVQFVRVETALDMAAAVDAVLPVDAAVMVAAVADWRLATPAARKVKKDADGAPPTWALVENPDILKTVSAPGPRRPRLVVGFAAETDALEVHARAKRQRKGCDWIVANDVSGDVMGGDENSILLIKGEVAQPWPRLDKLELARRLADDIADHFANLGPSAD